MSYGYPQQQQPPYGHQQPAYPPYQGYGTPPPPAPAGTGTYYPPPPYPPPAAGDLQLPPGWASRFDPRFQTWYYINEATAIPQWSHPAGIAPARGPVGGPPSRGYSSAPPQQDPRGYYAGASPGPLPQPDYRAQAEYERKRAEEAREDGNKKMAAGAVGGLLVGGAVGAFAMHEIDEHNESDREDILEEREKLLEEREEFFDDD